VAIVAGTKAETVIEVLRKLPESQRKKVKEITLDMAGSMDRTADADDSPALFSPGHPGN
jgi:transposase